MCGLNKIFAFNKFTKIKALVSTLLINKLEFGLSSLRTLGKICNAENQKNHV